ncbi:MAG: molecular chaperone DnaK, partial [Armatimonadetes bacterium]|nr:molecular chaperone DnaK [Armatimonadota bacterium]
GDKVPADQKTNIEAGMAEVRSALNTEDLDHIRRATDELQQASYKLSEIMYQQAGGGAQQAEGPGPEAEAPTGAETPGGGDDVIDAEFKEQ